MERGVVQTTGADRYVIVEYLAEGGMGAIFLGKKMGLEGFEKEVVLKQLLPEYTAHREFIDLFLREARLSASLDHANIVHTIDLVTTGEDYFMVMEYVSGGDLRTIMRRIKQRGHQLSSAASLFIAREVLSALAYAHEKKSPEGEPLKLIHRDVSPSNIMISAAGEVKLTDFGIAKVSTHKSVFYKVKGKVGYMSPEQAYCDRPLDRRSDLYSVGVCLYEMLCGERLFVADLLSTADQIYSQPLPLLEDLPGIPQGIDRVLSKVLSREPDRRYQSAHEFQDDLVQVAYDNELIFTPPDLASHLKHTCGPDPQTWNKEEEIEKPKGGTEILRREATQFSGVELTSIFTELRDKLAKDLDEDLDEDEDMEPTRHAEMPRELASPPQAPSFDISNDGLQDSQATIDLRGREMFGDSQGTVNLRGKEHFDDAHATVHMQTRQAPAPSRKERRMTLDVGIVENRLEEDLDPPLLSSADLTAGVRPMSKQRHRVLMIIAVGLLLASATALAILVALSGPDLEDRPERPFFINPPDATTSDVRPADSDGTVTRIPRVSDLGSGALNSTGRSLQVKSSPSRARVYLDGAHRCNTPCTIEDLSANRIYLLSVRLKQYVSWSSLVDMRGKLLVQINAYLSEEPDASKVGYLSIQSKPRAEVYVDDKEIGRVTSEGRIPLPPGQYEITLSHPRRKRRPKMLVIIHPRQTVLLRRKF